MIEDAIKKLCREGYAIVEHVPYYAQDVGTELERLPPSALDATEWPFRPSVCLRSILDEIVESPRLVAAHGRAPRLQPDDHGPNDGWHVDVRYSDGPAPRTRALRSGDRVLLSVLYPIDDFTEENGATELVPGSHLCPPDVDLPSSWVQVFPSCTDAVIIVSSHVTHRAGLALPGKQRRADLLRFEAVWR